MLVFDDSDDEGPLPQIPCFPFVEIKAVGEQKEQPDFQTEIVSSISKGGLSLKSNEQETDLAESAKKSPEIKDQEVHKSSIEDEVFDEVPDKNLFNRPQQIKDLAPVNSTADREESKENTMLKRTKNMPNLNQKKKSQSQYSSAVSSFVSEAIEETVSNNASNHQKASHHDHEVLMSLT